MSKRLGLYMYTVYDHPSDFPNDWVVREWRIVRGNGRLPGSPQPGRSWTFFTLESARNHLADMGLVSIARGEEDDPAIVETWV